MVLNDDPHHVYLLLSQAHSSANVEVYQQFPDGVPRKVFISGTPECVELAAFMVEEVRRQRQWYHGDASPSRIIPVSSMAWCNGFDVLYEPIFEVPG